MAQTEAYVFEEGKLDDYDVVCPGCGTIVARRHNKGPNNFNTTCPQCQAWLYEYSAAIIPHGDADKIDLHRLQQEVVEYWSRSRHSEAQKQRFEDAARELGIHRYSAER